VHNIVSTEIKGRIPKINRDYITYRSYKNFDHEKYVEDLEKIDYVNIGNESDINSTYEIFEKSYLEVVNKHIPLKKRKPVQTPAPFMNKTLRKEIYKKRMLHNKFFGRKQIPVYSSYLNGFIKGF
jgi:hypothetical protein